MLTTSKRIVLLFTGSITLAVLLFGVIINILFFGFRFQREIQFSRTPHLGAESMMMKRLGNMNMGRPRNSLILPERSDEAKELRDHTVRKNIAHIDDDRYLYMTDGKVVIVNTITHLVDDQLMLVWLTIILVIFFGGIGY